MSNLPYLYPLHAIVGFHTQMSNRIWHQLNGSIRKPMSKGIRGDWGKITSLTFEDEEYLLKKKEIYILAPISPRHGSFLKRIPYHLQWF